MISFADVTKQVHLINDLILSDMLCYTDDGSDTSFSRHLLATKNWFSRISWANKKHYLLALLEDVQSAWALSMLLKSLWNCRPKDAVHSANERDSTVWSSYDQIPMDHNRTAVPVTTLAQVMKNDRIWFLTLEPEAQAMVLSELLTVAGGPLMWHVLQRAQTLYERYRNHQLLNLQECIVVGDRYQEKATPGDKTNKDAPSNVAPDNIKPAGQAQKDLEANLAAWNATIKSMKDSLKLEEVEMTFNDGTKRKIWKVNRPKPEAIETVDFLQLLPSTVGKMILSYLPRTQLSDYAKVNKYWAFLIEEFKADLVARAKINTEFDKMRENMLRHDTSLELVEQIDIPQVPPLNSANISVAISQQVNKLAPASNKASEKSGGAYSMRNLISDKLNKPNTQLPPIRNMADLTERLEQRGAVDENLWNWCQNLFKQTKAKKKKFGEGVLSLGNIHFPCPMMKKCIDVPLAAPLMKNPATTVPLKPKRNLTDSTVLQTPKEKCLKRYSLWTRNFSGLYPVFKIPSYQSPI